MKTIEFMKDHKLITEEFHKVGILVHPYAHKDDFLKYGDSPIEELYYYFEYMKVDGIFSENPKTAIVARDYFKNQKFQIINEQYLFNKKDNYYIDVIN